MTHQTRPKSHSRRALTFVRQLSRPGSALSVIIPLISVLLLTLVFAIAYEREVNAAPAAQGSAAQGSAAQGSAAQGSAAQGSAAQGSAAQGSAAQGSATQGSAAQGSAAQGSAAQGSAAQGSAAQGSAAQGSAASKRVEGQEVDQEAETQEQSEAERSASQEPKIKKNTLMRALAKVVRRASEKMVPDVVNGLIRVVVPTTRGVTEDRPSREVLSAVISQMIAEVPHHFAVNTERTVDVLRDFDRSGQELTTPRSISLGQHLGARYVFRTELTVGESSDSLTLDVQVISVKRRGAIYTEQLQISVSDYQSLRARAVFDERRLSATWRSALIPGWGQLYQRRTGAAAAYIALSAGLTIGALWTHSLGQEAASRYQENTSDSIHYRFEANNHFARSRLMWGALGVTWLSSIAAAYLQGEDRAHIQLNFDPTQGGLNISGAF